MLTRNAADSLAQACHDDPFAVLGNTVALPCHDRDDTLTITLPPLTYVRCAPQAPRMQDGAPP